MIINFYFGQVLASDFTLHKVEARKNLYINRHKKNENWTKSGFDTAGWWSYKFLWSYPTKEEAFNQMKKDSKEWGMI